MQAYVFDMLGKIIVINWTQAWAPSRGGLWGYKPTQAVFATLCYLTNPSRCTTMNQLVSENKCEVEKKKILS